MLASIWMQEDRPCSNMQIQASEASQKNHRKGLHCYRNSQPCSSQLRGKDTLPAHPLTAASLSLVKQPHHFLVTGDTCWVWFGALFIFFSHWVEWRRKFLLLWKEATLLQLYLWWCICIADVFVLWDIRICGEVSFCRPINITRQIISASQVCKAFMNSHVLAKYVSE